jgi:hypothetical protein
MTALDRLLVLTAVLSGALAARPALGGPDNPQTCTDVCQQTPMYYDCVKKHCYKFEADDCFHCVPKGGGNCVKRDNTPGGDCVKRDDLRKWHYLKDYTKACECAGFVVRVEVSAGTKLTEWDMFEGDHYYTCEKTVAPPEDGVPQ